MRASREPIVSIVAIGEQSLCHECGTPCPGWQFVTQSKRRAGREASRPMAAGRLLPPAATRCRGTDACALQELIGSSVRGLNVGNPSVHRRIAHGTGFAPVAHPMTSVRTPMSSSRVIRILPNPALLALALL